MPRFAQTLRRGQYESESGILFYGKNQAVGLSTLATAAAAEDHFRWWRRIIGSGRSDAAIEI